LVPDDGAADPKSKVVTIDVILFRGVEIIGERVGIPDRVAIRQKYTSAKLVGSGACLELHLSGAASKRSVGWSDNDANFFHEIGTGYGCREHAIVISAVVHTDTIARDDRHSRWSSGKAAAADVGGGR